MLTFFHISPDKTVSGYILFGTPTFFPFSNKFTFFILSKRQMVLGKNGIKRDSEMYRRY